MTNSAAPATDLWGRLTAERDASVAQLAALQHDFDGVVAASASANGDDEHDPEGATIAFEREQLSDLAQRTRERVDQLDAALRRLDEGGYGICATCGSPIGTVRLEARPFATTCMRCA